MQRKAREFVASQESVVSQDLPYSSGNRNSFTELPKWLYKPRTPSQDLPATNNQQYSIQNSPPLSPPYQGREKIQNSPFNQGEDKIPHRTSYLLASGSFDGKVRLWDIDAGECLRILEEHTDRVWSVHWSPDGKILASSSSDRMVKLWEVSSGKCLESLRGHSQAIRTLAFSPDGKTLASGSDDHSVRLWNYSNRQGG